MVPMLDGKERPHPVELNFHHCIYITGYHRHRQAQGRIRSWPSRAPGFVDSWAQVSNQTCAWAELGQKQHLLLRLLSLRIQIPTLNSRKELLHESILWWMKASCDGRKHHTIAAIVILPEGYCKNQVFFCECIIDLFCRRSFLTWIRSYFNQQLSQISLARISCPLSESVQWSLVKAAKAVKHTKGSGDDCERGGRARAWQMSVIMIRTWILIREQLDESSATSTSSLGLSSDSDKSEMRFSQAALTTILGQDNAEWTTRAVAHKYLCLSMKLDSKKHLDLEAFRGGGGVLKGTDIMCREELIAYRHWRKDDRHPPGCAELQWCNSISGGFLELAFEDSKSWLPFAISEAQNRLASASVRAIKAALGKDKRGNERTLNVSLG